MLTLAGVRAAMLCMKPCAPASCVCLLKVQTLQCSTWNEQGFKWMGAPARLHCNKGCKQHHAWTLQLHV